MDADVLYIGDVSEADAAVLQLYGLSAKKGIVEFGVGASTQILARASKVPFVSVETDPAWIERTKENFDLLGIDREKVTYLDLFHGGLVEDAKKVLDGGADLVFVDGAPSHRILFARLFWPLLVAGGKLVFHDARTVEGARAWEFLAEVIDEISRVEMCPIASNMLVVEKRPRIHYEDWNVAEEREHWMAGYEPPPEDALAQLVKRAALRRGRK